LNGLYAPNQGFLPKYAGGVYDLEAPRWSLAVGSQKASFQEYLIHLKSS